MEVDYPKKGDDNEEVKNIFESTPNEEVLSSSDAIFEPLPDPIAANIQDTYEEKEQVVIGVEDEDNQKVMVEQGAKEEDEHHEDDTNILVDAEETEDFNCGPQDVHDSAIEDDLILEENIRIDDDEQIHTFKSNSILESSHLPHQVGEEEEEENGVPQEHTNESFYIKQHPKFVDEQRLYNVNQFQNVHEEEIDHEPYPLPKDETGEAQDDFALLDVTTQDRVSSTIPPALAPSQVIVMPLPIPLDPNSPVQPSPCDVLCGRGGGTNNHPGNKNFREIVAIHQPQYIHAKKREKKLIATKIVSLVRASGGRFLRMEGNSKDCTWTDIGDKKASEKTSQALREGMDVRQKKFDGNSPFMLGQQFMFQQRFPQPLFPGVKIERSPVKEKSAEVLPQLTKPINISTCSPIKSEANQQNISNKETSGIELNNGKGDADNPKCLICGSNENPQRPIIHFPPNITIHAFCGTLAASAPYNKPEFELLHLKGIKHKYRHDELITKLLNPALSKTRSAVNTINGTRLYLVRDLEVRLEELKKKQVGKNAVRDIRIGEGKRGRGRPKKGEVITPKVKRPRGRPKKEPKQDDSPTGVAAIISGNI